MTSRLLRFVLLACVVSWTFTAIVLVILYRDVLQNDSVFTNHQRLLLPGGESFRHSTTFARQQTRTRVVSNQSATPQNSDNHVIQVVTTRYMQRQPTLMALGKARLALFQTFCLPTIILSAELSTNHHQDQDAVPFLWTILVDPDIPSELLDLLVRLVKPYPYVFVIRTNEYLLDLRSQHAVSSAVVESGNVTLLERASQQSRSRILVETSLDIDDGLHPRVLPLIRQIAYRHLAQHHAEQAAATTASSSNNWMALCIDRHLEWHFGNASDTSGILRFLNKDICVTAGLTFARGPKVSRSDLPNVGHHVLRHVLPDCHHDMDDHHNHKNDAATRYATTTTACLRRLVNDKPLGAQPQAIRARSFTSAGMADVTDSFVLTLTEDTAARLWKFLKAAFHVRRHHVEHAKQYLVQYSESILRDNIQGQCTKGHSCKPETKQKLMDLLTQHSNETNRQGRRAKDRRNLLLR